MYFEVSVIITLSVISAVLGLLLLQTRKMLLSETETATKALESALRADERAAEQEKLLHEFMEKPVQAFIPQGSIELMTKALVQSLAQTLNAPMEIPIFPREKPPEKPE